MLFPTSQILVWCVVCFLFVLIGACYHTNTGVDAMPSTLAQSDIANTIWSCALVVFGLLVCFAWLFPCVVFCAVVAFVCLFFGGTIMTYSCCEGCCQDCLLFSFLR